MKIQTHKLTKSTNGHGHFIDLTNEISEILERSGLEEGQMTVFNIGSTAGIVTFEYEPGLVKDMNEIYEKIAPHDIHYHHHDTWNDGNGFSHVRAALQGPSLTIPFEKNTLLLGTWQQVVLAEFDNRPRDRQIVVQLMGS